MAAKLKTTAAGDDDLLLLLPIDIWREILARLPVKSILRCRSVGKSWYSLISCPNFINHHSIRNLNNNGSRILLRTYGDDKSYVWSYISYDDSFMESHEHNDIPRSFLSQDVRTVGSCNGLVCFYKYEDLHKYWVDAKNVSGRNTFLIWNPTIRKVVELPCGAFRGGQASYLGFGFDSKTNDYKVLCISDKNVCEIFDLRKGVWRAISPQMRPWDVPGLDPGCYLHGAVHWTGYTHVNGDGILLSFDMSDEGFREIKMPFMDSESNVVNATKVKSVALGGLIHVIVWQSKPVLSEGCSIWAMKEYGVVESWTKMCVIDMRSTQLLPATRLLPTSRVEPEKFMSWKNGEILMVHHSWTRDGKQILHKQGLALYDIGIGKYNCLFSTNKHISKMCIYEESLALMSTNYVNNRS